MNGSDYIEMDEIRWEREQRWSSIEDTRQPDEREENPYEDDDFQFDWDRDTELERE